MPKQSRRGQPDQDRRGPSPPPAQREGRAVRFSPVLLQLTSAVSAAMLRSPVSADNGPDDRLPAQPRRALRYDRDCRRFTDRTRGEALAAVRGRCGCDSGRPGIRAQRRARLRGRSKPISGRCTSDHTNVDRTSIGLGICVQSGGTSNRKCDRRSREIHETPLSNKFRCTWLFVDLAEIRPKEGFDAV
jgi:hypothetical protein